MEGAEQLVAEIQQRLTRASPQRRLEVVVGGLLEFLVQRPYVLPLVEREALMGEGVMEGARVYLTLMRAGSGVVGGGRAGNAADPDQLLLSLISLCCFPLAHPALLRDFGGRPDRRFVEARRRHVVALLRGALRPAEGGWGPPAPRSARFPSG